MIGQFLWLSPPWEWHLGASSCRDSSMLSHWPDSRWQGYGCRFCCRIRCAADDELPCWRSLMRSCPGPTAQQTNSRRAVTQGLVRLALCGRGIEGTDRKPVDCRFEALIWGDRGLRFFASASASTIRLCHCADQAGAPWNDAQCAKRGRRKVRKRDKIPRSQWTAMGRGGWSNLGAVGTNARMGNK